MTGDTRVHRLAIRADGLLDRCHTESDARARDHDLNRVSGARPAAAA